MQTAVSAPKADVMLEKLAWLRWKGSGVGERGEGAPNFECSEALCTHRSTIGPDTCASELESERNAVQSVLCSTSGYG